MEYLPINWQNGMKLTEDHFSQMENSARFELVQLGSSQVNDGNYGLLPSSTPVHNPDIELSVDPSGELNVKVNYCKALFPNGAFLEINSRSPIQLDLQGNLQEKLDKYGNQGVFYVVLNLRPYERRKVGDPDPEESPPRRPFTIPSVFLSLSQLPAEHISTPEHAKLTIAQVKVIENRVELNQEYIPPLNILMANEVCRSYLDTWTRALEGLVVECRKTIRRVFEVKRRSSESVEFTSGETISLADAVFKTTAPFLQGLGRALPQVKTQCGFSPPYFSFVVFQQLVWSYRSSFEALHPTEQERFLNYLESSMQLGGLIDRLDEFTKANYNHESISNLLMKIKVVLEAFSRLYNPGTGLPSKDYKWKKESAGEIIVIHREDDKTTLG